MLSLEASTHFLPYGFTQTHCKGGQHSLSLLLGGSLLLSLLDLKTMRSYNSAEHNFFTTLLNLSNRYLLGDSYVPSHCSGHRVCLCCSTKYEGAKKEHLRRRKIERQEWLHWKNSTHIILHQNHTRNTHFFIFLFI